MEVITAEKIAQSLPNSVLGQKIYKCKVNFNEDKRSKSYSRRKNFSANCNEYLVIDGEINYLPAEAYGALTEAVTLEATTVNKKQAEYGIDIDDPNDRFAKIEHKRYDLTILDTYNLVVIDGKKTFLSEKAEIDAKVQEDTVNAIVEARMKERESFLKESESERIKQLEDELERIKASSKVDIPDPISDEDLEKLMSDEEE